MIPLYILGLLLRFGPQHGYQIKKLVEEQLADFAQIKLPTIYYHLEKLEASGSVDAQTSQEGARPEKRVYRITEQGQLEFHAMLRKGLDIRYRPTFDADALFYFSEHLDEQEMLNGLTSHLTRLRESLEHIQAHRALTISHLPKEMGRYAEMIFDHHISHFDAEIAWVERSIQTMLSEGRT